MMADRMVPRADATAKLLLPAATEADWPGHRASSQAVPLHKPSILVAPTPKRMVDRSVMLSRLSREHSESLRGPSGAAFLRLSAHSIASRELQG